MINEYLMACASFKENMMNNMKEKNNQGSWKVGFSKFVGVLNKIVDALAGIAAGAIVVTVIIQILGRVVGNPAPWTEEGTRFIFIWIIFLGIGMGFRNSESARVTIMVGYAPPIIKKLSKWTYTFFSMVFFGFMIVYGYQLMMQQVNMNEMGSALMIPMWLIGASVPVSGILCVIGLLESLILHPHTVDIESLVKPKAEVNQ